MKKIESFQSLRAVSFIFIFLCHVGLSYHQAPLGVSIFFVLSGFLLSWKHIDDGLSDYGLKDSVLFSIIKIKKLYFLHVLTTLLMALLRLISIITSGFKLASFVRLLLNVLLNISLLQSWVPDSNINTSLNGVSWYLSVCLFLYFTFPFVLRLLKKVRSSFTFLFIGLLILLLQVFSCVPFINIFGASSPVYIWFMYCFPLFRFGDFIIGICMGIVIYNRDNTKKMTILNGSVFEVLAIVLTILFFVFLDLSSSNAFVISLQNWTSIYIVLAMFWVYAFFKKNGIVTFLLSNNILIKLGDISAYAFLIHFVVIRYTDSLLSHIIGVQSIYVRYIVIMFEFVISIILSILYKRIDTRLAHK